MVTNKKGNPWQYYQEAPQEIFINKVKRLK